MSRVVPPAPVWSILFFILLQARLDLPPHHAALVVSPVPVPDPPPSYLFAFLALCHVNPRAESHLGQS